jgi:hypothetical protein
MDAYYIEVACAFAARHIRRVTCVDVSFNLDILPSSACTNFAVLYGRASLVASNALLLSVELTTKWKLCAGPLELASMRTFEKKGGDKKVKGSVAGLI